MLAIVSAAVAALVVWAAVRALRAAFERQRQHLRDAFEPHSAATIRC